MARARIMLFGLVLGCFLPGAAYPLFLQACCVCTGCPTAATICVRPPTGDTAPDTIGNGGAAGPLSGCPIVCPDCATSQFVSQSCSDLLQCQQPVRAPATSHGVLTALGVLLAVYGASAVRRVRRDG